MIKQRKIPRNYCFLDLETTGFNPEKDSIIEISFITRTPDGKEINRMDEVIFPDKSEMSAFVSNLTGITQEELNQSGKKFTDLMDEAREKIGDAVIIGHNIDFDINFLIANGLENLTENPRIDTHELARIILPNEKSYALEVLSNKYEMSHENAHRAMSDVKANILFFNFLVEKIGQIPAKFLDEIRPVLESKTDWFAKNLFLNTAGTENYVYSMTSREERANDGINTNKNKTQHTNGKKTNSYELDLEKEGENDLLTNIPEVFWEKSGEITPENSLFIKQTDNMKSAEFAKKIAEKQEKSLIITSKLKYFPEIKQFPSPQVILDSKKLNNFAESREKLNNAEISFWLQAKFREFLGFRGKHFFNLFFMQRDYWETVCLTDENQPVFREILAEKSEIQTLAIDPYTFLKLIDLDIFKNRTLLIDESEVFANALLFSTSKKWSFLPAMNSADEDESAKAQFWVTNFCREVIEEKIQHAISPFPEKTLLDKTEKFPVFADGMRDFKNLQNKEELHKVLLNSREKTVRWATYFPKNGNLEIGAWHPEDWRDLKNKLAKFSKIFFHRHEIDESFSFFRIFIGATKGEKIDPDFLKNKVSLNIPENLVSVKSPDFNAFTIDKIEENFAGISAGEVLAANFSSISTLKNIFDELAPNVADNEKVYGESASGGTAKILNLMKQNSAKKQLLLMKNIATPELKNYQIKKLLIQKFIFNPPQPLLEEVENVMKISRLNFWSVWIMPQITANLSRVMGSFPDLEEVIFLDARENSRWGKSILRELF